MRAGTGGARWRGRERLSGWSMAAGEGRVQPPLGLPRGARPERGAGREMMRGTGAGRCSGRTRGGRVGGYSGGPGGERAAPAARASRAARAPAPWGGVPAGERWRTLVQALGAVWAAHLDARSPPFAADGDLHTR